MAERPRPHVSDQSIRNKGPPTKGDLRVHQEEALKNLYLPLWERWDRTLPVLFPIFDFWSRNQTFRGPGPAKPFALAPSPQRFCHVVLISQKWSHEASTCTFLADGSKTPTYGRHPNKLIIDNFNTCIILCVCKEWYKSIYEVFPPAGLEVFLRLIWAQSVMLNLNVIKGR